MALLLTEQGKQLWRPYWEFSHMAYASTMTHIRALKD